MGNLRTRGLVWYFERRARGKSYSRYKEKIEETSTQIVSIFSDSKDNEKSRWLFTHVIGMEKWMQQRIKVALGEPFVRDEYDIYRPSQDEPWDKLQQLFVETRNESVQLCDALDAKQANGSQKILHNEFGDLSVKGWLEYLLFHGQNHAKYQWFTLPGWNLV